MREGLDPGGSLGSLCVSRELRDIGAWAAPFPAPSAEGQGEKPHQPLDPQLLLLPSFDLGGHMQAPSDLGPCVAEVLAPGFTTSPSFLEEGPSHSNNFMATALPATELHFRF